jgi:hypothetical protein
MYHYTYIIKHKTQNLKYIGVRSCKCHPTDDTSYWGSSKHLPKNVKYTHNKRVLSIFNTRKQALEHEIYLHNKYEVNQNPFFYNKAKQTSTGFDTSGCKLTFTEDHKRKISDAMKGKKHSLERRKNSSENWKNIVKHPDYVNPRKGVVMPDELKSKISKARKQSGSSKGVKNTTFTPWFITDGNTTQLFYDITKTEKSLKDGFSSHTYRNLYKKSKGVKKIAKGVHKGKIIGNIPFKDDDIV